jgi:hypothetical protein
MKGLKTVLEPRKTGERQGKHLAKDILLNNEREKILIIL